MSAFGPEKDFDFGFKMAQEASRPLIKIEEQSLDVIREKRFQGSQGLNKDLEEQNKRESSQVKKLFNLSLASRAQLINFFSLCSNLD